MFSSLKQALPLALATSSLVSGAAFDASLVERQDSITCASGVHMIVGAGCGIPCASAQLSLLSTLVSNVSYAFPGSDYWMIPYDGSMKQAQVSTPLAIAHFNSYVTTCPQTPIVFIGYSLGGIIMLNTLCGGVSAQYAPNVIAAISYGEETFRNGLSYDAGTCQAPAPNFPRNNTAQCAPYAAAIQDYCDATDPNCCSGGLDQASHFTYPDIYDKTALAFIISRYAALAATQTTSAAPSTSTSISTGTLTVSTTIAASSTSTIATPSTTSVAPSTTLVAPTTRSTTTTTFTGYSNSTVTRSSSVSLITVLPVTGSNTKSTSAAVGGASVSTVTTIPHYSIPAVSSVSSQSLVTSFPDIPNSGILLPSSVYNSYLSAVATTASIATGTAATGGAVTAAATAKSSGSSTATGSVPQYTGAAAQIAISGAMALVAGAAALIVA